MLALASALFALSGAAALAFETLWFHQAALAFGSGVTAQALVLAAFMAGLATGAALAARTADALRRPFHVFAALELATGLGGLALVLGLPELGPALAHALGPLAEQGARLDVARFALAFALLGLPSAAMGYGLPLLVRALAAEPERFGPTLGRLYGWNTLGAVAGVVALQSWGLAALGIHGAAGCAAGANALAALAALALARHVRAPEPTPRSARRVPWRAGLACCVAAFASGFALLALEGVAFRFLALFLVTRAETFAGLLACVLAGIGAGGLLGEAWLRRRPDAHRLAAATALLAGAGVAAGYAAFPLAAASLPAHKLSGAGPVLRLALPLLLPVSLASGILFVLLGAGLRRALPASAQAAGRLTVANTLGAATGSLAAAFALLPGLGMERALFALAVLYAVLGLALAWTGATRRGLLPAGLAWGAGALLFPFGALEHEHVARALAAYELPANATVHRREGVRETILWVEIPWLGRPYVQRLVTDSFSMSATDVQARRYMELYAVLPAAVHPDLRSALLVSYGVGSTARALTGIPGIERIDVVDISREILEESARAFPDPARDPLRDPRVRVHVEDGRYFLRSGERRYDLVTGEPPPPVLAGVVNLYTREYFEAVAARLAEGGLFTTWLPLRQLSDSSALAIVRAFCDAFPDCSLWRGMSFELMLLGSRAARGPVDDRSFRAQWRDPVRRAELSAIGLERPEQLGALFIADADQLARWTRDVAPLVDAWPRRIDAPPSSLEAEHRLYAEWLDPRACRARYAASSLPARLLPAGPREAAFAYFDLQHLLDTFGEGIRSDAWSERLTDLDAVLARSDLRTPVLWLLGSDADAQRILDEAPGRERERPDVQWHLAARALADRDEPAALAALRRAADSPETFERATALRLFLLCREGRRSDAATLARESAPRLAASPRSDDLWRWLAARCGIGP